MPKTRPGPTDRAPPAGITKRVGICCPTRSADDTLRRARRLYHCRRYPRSPLLRLQCAGPQWSRPVRIHVCSMFARMPRYGPALPGIRSAARMRATAQNGRSRYALALSDSSSRRISEQSSGLLIRGFGVQVPGGAQVTACSFRLQVVLFCHSVGPWWVPCGTSFRLAESSVFSSGTLKARLSRRVGVVRVLGSFGQVGPRAIVGAFPGCLTGQTV